MRVLVFLILMACLGCINPVPQPPVVPPTTGFMYGSNTFHWVPVDSLKMFDAVRVYMMWQWFEQQPGRVRFDPAAGGAGEYDKYLKALKAAGIAPVLCLNTSPEWLVGAGVDQETAPTAPGADLSDPKSYLYFARLQWQFAARYGGVKHKPETLMVDTTERWTNEGKNRVESGMGLVKFIEVWNEPDKWWKGDSRANMKPEQYAAMLSAVYDGHEGRLGTGFGIKGADPSIQVVMAGLTSFDTAYVGRMNRWFLQNRTDKKFAADVFNFHHYCNADGGIFKGREFGVSPRTDGVGAIMVAAVAKCAEIEKNKPVWWSEFGYDTDNAGTPHYAHPDSAARWLMDSYVVAEAAGVDACFLFNAVDEPKPGWLFQSSGIMYGTGSSNKYGGKPAYFYLKEGIKKRRGK